MVNLMKTARLTLVGAAAALMASGMLVWMGKGGDLVPLHMALGLVLVLSLWAIAGVALRLGVPVGIVALAVVSSLVAAVIGVAQGEWLPGGSHWAVEALHLISAMSIVAWGQALVLLSRRTMARGGRLTGHTSIAQVK